MNNYAKMEVAPDRYEAIKSIQAANGTPYSEQSFGSRKNLYVGNALIASTVQSSNLDLGELSPELFVSFIAAFNRQVYARILKYPHLMDQNIQFKGMSREKNTKLWNTLKSPCFFYNIDLDSAYWQIAHKLGYISKTMFEKYMDQEQYKQAKRYCISFLARKNTMKYPNGQVINCDIRPLQRIYDNIRNELYRCIQKCVENTQMCLEYNIDGLSVMAQDVDTVKKCLNDMQLRFKIIECVKISPTEYSYKGKVRKFTRNMAKMDAVV